MKNIFLSIMTLLIVVACQNNKERYTQNAPEIETYKKALKDYEMANWEALASHYADTAKVYLNATKKNPQSVAEMIEQDKSDFVLFSSVTLVPEESEFEKVLTDKGHTWVNFWGLWQGRLKATNELFEIPVHLTARFENGKIVEEHGYWNNSSIAMALMKLPETTASETAAQTTEQAKE